MLKKFNVTVNGETFAVEVDDLGCACVDIATPAPVAAAQAPAPASTSTPPPAAPAPTPTAPVGNAKTTVESPLPGTVLKINVSVGQAIKKGDVLVVLEAMKMENDITASTDGVVQGIHVNSGATVQTGDVLISLG